MNADDWTLMVERVIHTRNGGGGGGGTFVARIAPVNGQIIQQFDEFKGEEEGDEDNDDEEEEAANNRMEEQIGTFEVPHGNADYWMHYFVEIGW